MKHHIKPEPMLHMDDNDYVWLHGALVEAFANVNNSSLYFTKVLDGEVYTHLRTMVKSSGLRTNSPLRRLFALRKRNLDFWFDHLKQLDKEKVIIMFNVIKRGRLNETQDIDTCLYELENLLTGMRANVSQMADAAKRSEEVRDKIEELNEFLTNA